MFHDKTPARIKGFYVGMASKELLAGKPEVHYPRPADPADVSAFQEQHREQYGADRGAVHGTWAPSGGDYYTQEVSVVIPDPTEAKEAARRNLQRAAWAPQHTKVREGVRVNSSSGAEVFPNMRGGLEMPTAVRQMKTGLTRGTAAFIDIGANDSDPKWNSSAAKLANGRPGLSNYEVDSRSWSKTGGETVQGQPVRLREVLQTINDNRTAAARAAHSAAMNTSRGPVDGA
jgi:hypothetical protein